MNRIIDEQLYTNKLDNFIKMDHFCKRQKLWNITADEINNLESPISITQINIFVKNFQEETSDPHNFTTIFYWTLKEEIIPLLTNTYKHLGKITFDLFPGGQNYHDI